MGEERRREKRRREGREEEGTAKETREDRRCVRAESVSRGLGQDAMLADGC